MPYTTALSKKAVVYDIFSLHAPTSDKAVSVYTFKPDDIDKVSSATSTCTTVQDASKQKSIVFGPSLKINDSGDRFNLGGSLQAKKNYILVDVPSSGAKIVIHFYNNGGSAGGRTLQYKDVSSIKEDGIELVFGDVVVNGTKETVASSKEDIVETFEISDEGKYAIGATNGVYITEIDITM